jgi:hypothetical protein
MEPIVGTDFKRMKIVTGLLLLIISNCFGQSNARKTFGLVISYGYTGSVSAAGVGVVYAGSPFFTDLEIVNSDQKNYSVDLFKDYSLKKHLILEQSIGYTPYGHSTYYNYDLANSINNIVSDRRKYAFLDLTHKIKKDVVLGKSVGVFGLVGFSFNYLTKATAEYVNFVGGSYSKSFQDRKDIEHRFSLGYEVGVGFDFKVVDGISLQCRSSYNKLLNKYNMDQRRLYALQFGLGITKAF